MWPVERDRTPEWNLKFHLSSLWQWKDYRRLIGQIKVDLAASPVNLFRPSLLGILCLSSLFSLSRFLPLIVYFMDLSNSSCLQTRQFLSSISCLFLCSLVLPVLWFQPLDPADMKLSILGVIVGVYWYCCCFQSSICGEQSLLIPTWIQPFVCLPEEGKGTRHWRQPLWFSFGPSPAWLWPCSRLVIVSPRSSCRPLSPLFHLRLPPPPLLPHSLLWFYILFAQFLLSSLSAITLGFSPLTCLCDIHSLRYFLLIPF